MPKYTEEQGFMEAWAANNPQISPSTATQTYNSGIGNLKLDGKIVNMYRQDTWSTLDSTTHSWRWAFSDLLTTAGLGSAGVTNYEEKGNYTSEEGDRQLFQGFENTMVSNDVYLLMEEGFPKITSTNAVSNPFDTYISSFEESNLGKIVNGFITRVNAAGGATTDKWNGAKWQPWLRNAPAWNGSKGISTEYTFNFALGQFGIWSALEEVVKPILNLMAPCLPRKQKLAFAEGPWPNSTVLLARMINGAFKSLGDLFSGKGIGTLEDILTYGYSDFTWTMRFGTWMTFYHMIIENCEVKFSNKVDEDGWPVQGSIKLHLVGIVPMALQSKNSSNLAAKFGM